MIWSVLSVLVCLALLVKLMLFTDKQRQQSGLFYRVVVFGSAIYAFNHVLMFLYYPQCISPWVTLLHLALFVGAFLIRPSGRPHTRRSTDRRPEHLR